MRSASAGRTFFGATACAERRPSLDAPYVPLATFMIAMTSLCDRVALFFSIVAEIMLIDEVDEHDLTCGPQHNDEGLGAQGGYEDYGLVLGQQQLCFDAEKSGSAKKRSWSEVLQPVTPGMENPCFCSSS